MNLKVVILSLIVPFIFLVNGCSGGGSSSEGGSAETNVEVKETSFSIAISPVGDRSMNSVDLLEYTISVKRGTEELMDLYKNYISAQKNSDGSISLIFKEIIKENQNEGLTSLKVGDIVTLKAKGYTPQQIVVTQEMLEDRGTAVALKAIESRQTYAIADMLSGTTAVTPRKAFGARTKITEDSVVFETFNKQTTLTLPKTTYKHLARKISTFSRSKTTTQVYLDMTSIDPKTENAATIGNFTYDRAFEPANERAIRVSESNNTETALESVVMANLQMTTDAGDEIHCFGEGTFDPKTNRCSDTQTALLKMKVPMSQFQEYALKYNSGDRVIPLYSYSTVKATWIRQLDNDGNGMDGELVLEDNNNNGSADDGDALYIEGRVGHFSWWNGDYPTHRTCLNVSVDLTNNIGISHILIKGVNYSGREFKRYIRDTTISKVNGIPAKENSIVSVALIMEDGSVGDSTIHTTGEYSVVCEEVEKTLVAPKMNQNILVVNVTDLHGKPLKYARVSFRGRSYRTDAQGEVSITTAYMNDYNAVVGVYYDADGFSVRDSKEITQATTKVTFVLDVAKTTFTGKVVESINGKSSPAANTYVRISGSGYSKYVYTDEKGNFSIDLPTTKVNDKPNSSIRISKYNREYAFYPSYNVQKSLNTSKTDLGTFTLAFITHKIAGRVTDTLNNPLSGARVYAYGSIYRNTRTNENGYYELIFVGSKDQNVSLKASIYKDKYLSSKKHTVTTKMNGVSEVNLEIELRKATIKGTILTSKGIALENMYVYWSKDYYNRAITDENGNFTLQTYNSGDGYLRVYDPNNWTFLDFNKSNTIRDVVVKDVKVGEIKDLGNLKAVEANYNPVISSLSTVPNNPLRDTQFAINIDAYDPDGDAITYKLQQKYGSDASIVENNNTMLVTVNRSGYFSFKVTVEDEYANTTTRNISFYVKEHLRPTIDSITIPYPNGLSYFDKSKDMTVNVIAHSIEGNSLSYIFVLKNLITGEKIPLTSIANSVVLSKTLDDGRYVLMITVKDLYKSITVHKYITIDGSVAPVIDTLCLNNTSMHNGATLYIKKGDSVHFDVNLTAASANQSGLSWYWYIYGTTSYTQAKADVTFSTEGFYYGYVQVRDRRGRSDSRRFYIKVAKNQKPVVSSIIRIPSNIIKNNDGTYSDGQGNSIVDMSFIAYAKDSDSANLTYTFSNIDLDVNGLSDSDKNTSDNKAKYNLTGLKVGKHSVMVKVSDGVNNVEKYKTFSILENQPPRVISLIVPTKVKISKVITLQAYAEDPNGDKVTYKWFIKDNDNSNTKGTILNASSAIAEYQAPTQAQSVTIILEVSDGIHKVTRSVMVDVIKNQAPEIVYLGATPLSMIITKTVINLQAKYGDADGSVVSATYMLKDADGKLQTSFKASESGVLQIKDLKIEKSGRYTLILEIIDNDGLKATQQLSLEVKGDNTPPVISSLTATKLSLLPNEESVLNVVASDPDGTAVIIEWSVTPSSATLIKNSYQVDKVTFKSNVTGEYSVTALVIDKDGKKVSSSINLKVQDVILSLDADKKVVKTGEAVTLKALFSTEDAVGSDTRWQFTTKPSDAKSILHGDGATATFTPDVVGTYTVQAIATLHGVDYNATLSITANDSSNVNPDIEGVVTSSTGDVLAGVVVRLYNSVDASLYDQTTTTDSDGKYSFSGVTAGTYYLVVYGGSNYITQTQVITVK